MISHRYRCIFIHQRKTAGCSIINSFGFSQKQAAWALFNDGTLSKEWKHRDSVTRRYIVFAVARNPWDRFISGWKYLAATKNQPLLTVLRDLPKEGHDYRHLTRPQLDTLMDNQVFVPDYVLRFEHLDEDYAKFCDVIGKPDKKLPKLNRTKHKSYKEYFDAPTLELFNLHFKSDIEFLGYDFSGTQVGENLKGKILV